jgi:hypothetical protein
LIVGDHLSLDVISQTGRALDGATDWRSHEVNAIVGAKKILLLLLLLLA